MIDEFLAFLHYWNEICQRGNGDKRSNEEKLDEIDNQELREELGIEDIEEEK